MRTTISKSISRARSVAGPVVRSLESVRGGVRFQGSVIRRGGVLASVVHAVAAQVPTQREPVVDVVVLGDAATARRLEQRAGLRVQLIGANGAALEELHRALRLIPRLGLIVDGLSGDGQDARLRQLLYYLLPRGRYVVLQPGVPVRSLSRELDRIRLSPGFSPNEGKVGGAHRELDEKTALRRLAAAVSTQHRRRDVLVVQKRLNHLLKVLEDDVTDELLSRRMHGWAKQDTIVPAVAVGELAPLTTNRDDLRWKFPTSYTLPRMALRTYQDVSCAPRQIVFKDNLLLPDAIRLTRRPYPEQIFTRNVDLRFVRLARPYGSLPVLEGAYYYLDDEHPTVYGHLLTDMAGRLWAWDRALEQEPDLKLLVSMPDQGATELPTWMQDLLEAYGIGRDRLHVLNKPARVERLYSATPQFVNFFFGYADPALDAVWGRWRDRVLAMREVPETPSRVFVSRPPGGMRECRNAAEVEAFFADAGFAVIRPAEHDLHTQVAIFANADRIAGFGGSAMLNAVFRGRDRRLLVMQPESHHAINEYLISSVYGDPVVQHYSKAELAGSGPGNALYQSPFTVDLEGDGELLREFAGS